MTAVRKAGLNSLTPLYVASGLQSYGARQGKGLPGGIMCTALASVNLLDFREVACVAVCRDATGRGCPLRNECLLTCAHKGDVSAADSYRWWALTLVQE